MSLTKILAAALVFASSSQAMAQDAPMIVGGTQVKDQTSVPFLVQLHDQNGVECGGSVIAPTWILSAAHCEEVLTGTSTVTIIGGSLKAGSGTTMTIKNHYVHPQFNAGSQTSGPSHDFMLIELTAPISDSKIKPIALADADFVSRGLEDVGQVMTVAGWGDLKENAGNYPSNAYSVQVPIVALSTANAANAYNGALDSSMLPAGYAKGGRDSCDGDSGGPLFTYDQAKKQNVLVGVVSWGDGCAQANKYGIYANVAVGYDWITSTIGGSTNTNSPKPPKKPKKPKASETF